MSAIVGFAVGEKAQGNAWEGLVRETVADVASLGDTAHIEQDIANIMATREDAYKHEFEETTLPTTYRTAKCVIIKALKNGISLLSPNGEVMGKTAIEKLCKEKVEVKTKDLLDKWEAFRNAYIKEEDAVLRNEVFETIRNFVGA